MRRFWVKYSYDHGRKQVGKAMDGETARHLAAEIRRKRANVKIESIRPLRGGMARTGR